MGGEQKQQDDDAMKVICKNKTIHDGAHLLPTAAKQTDGLTEKG